MKKILGSITLLSATLALGFWWYTHHLPSSFVISNLEENEIIILGHGGNGFRSDEPINSIEGFLKVIGHGNDGSELDVQLTNDSILIAFHDEELGRETNCEGRVGNVSLHELRKCATKNRSPTVNEVLSLNWKNGTIFSFDLKDNGLNPSYKLAFSNALKTLKTDFPQFRILLESQNKPFLSLMKKKGLSELYIYCQDPMVGLSVCQELGLSGISINNDLIEKEHVQLLQDAGFRVMIWGVGSALDNRSAALKSPDIVQTDNIRHLQQLLKSERK